MTTRETSSATCSPRYSTQKTDRPNRGPQIAAIARMLGQPLLPWQRHVADIGTEYDPVTNIPAYRELFVTTPRQSGKTTLMVAMLLDRCISWGERQACVWTGQNASAIRAKWLDDIVPLLSDSEKISAYIAKVRRVNGAEGLEFATGSRVSLLPNTADAGHGMVLDFVVMDELFADQDSRREAALGPAMSTRPRAQLLSCSTAGTEASTVYNRKVARGRNAVADGSTDDFAYFEWSAPDDWDPFDEDSYWDFMPALGHLTDLRAIRSFREALAEDPGQFERAYGNRPIVDGTAVWPPHVWNQVCSAQAKPDPSSISLGVDICWERNIGAIVVCDEDDILELVDYQAGGVGWLLDRVVELSERYDACVYFDAGGPIRSVDGLAALPRARPQNSREVIDACGGFFDAVADATLTVRSDARLDAAVKGLIRKNVSDRYVWHRKSSRNDVTPLYAATMAWAGARQDANQYAGPLVAVR